MLKYLHLEVCIKKRIFLYHPDWGLSIKAESSGFHFAQQSRGWGALTGGGKVVGRGYVSEPRRFPLVVLTRGGEGEMACSLEFAGLVIRKGNGQFSECGSSLGREKGTPLTLPLTFLKNKAIQEESAE